MTNHRVTAGPYTLELPVNGVAILYEADGAGIDHQLPGGVGYLEALVQFAGEVIRLQAMLDSGDPAELRDLLVLERQMAIGQIAEITRIRELAKQAERKFQEDRRDHDLALRDAIRETAATADEIAFWKHQAIYHRCLFLDPKSVHRLYLEDHPIWREAERQLEAQRIEENRERVSHAEAPRDPGGT